MCQIWEQSEVTQFLPKFLWSPFLKLRFRGSFCRYRKALYFWSLGISLYLELFCFLSFITIVLRNLCYGTHRRNRFRRPLKDLKPIKLHFQVIKYIRLCLSVAYNIVHLSYRPITVLKRNELQGNAACKKLQRKAQF